MNVLKKIISLAIIILLLFLNVKINVYASPDINTQKLVKAAVFLHNFEDLFISHVKKGLEDIQKENENKIQFTFLIQKEIKQFKTKRLVRC